MTNYVISGATTPSGKTGTYFVADGVFVEDEPANSLHIDADGLIVLPGLVDMHTHLRQPGREDAETVASGTAAAAKGGFTAVCAMANTTPVTDTPEGIELVAMLGRHEGKAQVVPVGAITKNMEGKVLAEMGLMAQTSAKPRLFSDDGKCVMDALLMRRAFEWVKPFDGVLAQHCQDANLAGPAACCDEGEVSARLGLGGWPWAAESSIIARDAQLAELTGARYHAMHVSTAEALDVVRWAKQRGIQITAEATPHHLFLSSELLAGYDTTYKVNPPLRSSEDIEALRQGVLDGTIDIIATDHAPHAPQDKDHSFTDAKPGMVGLEQALAVIMEVFVNPGLLGWEDVARLMSANPAKIARIEGQGRPIAPGEPANLVLIDPSRRAVVNREESASKSRNNPYHGIELPDPVVMTMWAGRLTYQR